MSPTAPLSNSPSAAAHVVALDIGGTKIAAAVLRYREDHAPEVILREAIPTEAKSGGDSVLRNAVALAQKMVAQSPDAVCGIGVGTAGRVNASDGSIAYANEIMPGWTGQPLRATLQAECGLPAAVLNDVQSHALGEARWGAGRGAKTCLVIAAGTGIGGGIITEGCILRGKHGFAGEIGATPNPLPAALQTGASGGWDLESVASGSGIEACYRVLSGRHLSGAQISQLAQEGDRTAAGVIDQAGYALGLALAGWTNMLDPERVILSGSVAKAGPLWREAVSRGFAERINTAQADLPIVEAELGPDAPLVGAAEFLRDAL